MSAGKRNERIRIETVTTVKDAARQPIETWALLREVWAQVLQQSGKEFIANAAITGGSDAAFLTLYQGDVDHKMRVVWRGKNYEIQ
ncbi:MAG: phage head closure protein, partial [Robiginitomaculum sp.]|nr:phage head closure protein [Robiginitomaculum sp.]